MKRYSVLAFLALVLVGCASSPPPAPVPGRVVLVSFDGLGADLAWGWIDGGVVHEPDGLAALAAKGLAARRLRMVNPTLTAVNHISLVTGALPEATGIVCNRFHPPGTPITDSLSGFSAPIAVPTLWQAARRAGVRVGVLTWPGADGTTAARRGDFGLVWPPFPLLAADVVELEPAAGNPAPAAVASADGVPAHLWALALEPHGVTAATLEVAVADGTPDGVAAYDRVLVRQDPAGDWRALAAGAWFPIVIPAPTAGDAVGPAGGWCKVLAIARDGGVRLYRGELNRLQAYPPAFAGSLAAAVGFWPGAPDGDALESWWLDSATGIDLDTYMEQADRFADYLDRVAAFALAHERPRLLLAYHPNPDEYEHAGLLEEPAQWAYSPGHARAAAEGMKRAGTLVDRSVARLWRQLDPGRDRLVAVSDHGHLPLHDLVSLSQALADAGLVTTREVRGRLRPASDTPLAVYASGGCAHVYVNLAGREPGGVIQPEDAPGLLRRAARVLADLELDGEPVVEAIYTRGEAAAIGLDSPASGDLIVFLEPGFACSERLGGPVFTPSRYYGQHGYLARHDPLCGIYFVRGAGVAAGRIGELPATAVAGRVAAALGVAWPPPPTR